MTSLARSRSISPDHQIFLKERYRSYSRVEGYVKHMNSIFHSQMMHNGEYDEVHEKISKFKTQTPLNDPKFKVSHYPYKGNDSWKIIDSQKEIIIKKKEFRSNSILKKRTKKKSKVNSTQSHKKKLRPNQEKIMLQERCFRCFKIQCSCTKMMKNSFLNKFLRKSQESKEKLLSPSPAQDSKSLLPLFYKKSVSKSESLTSAVLKHQKVSQESNSLQGNFLKISSFQSFRKIIK